MLGKKKMGLMLVSLAMLAACGSPGEPLPPSLELARPVRDLRATRKGNTVTLTWTAPTKTMDNHNIRRQGPTEICRASQAMRQCDIVARLSIQNTSDSAKADSSSHTYTDTLPSVSRSAEGKFVFAVRVLNSHGRSAGLSNQVDVPAVPTLPAPTDVRAQLTGDGVHLAWSASTNIPDVPGLRFAYRIYRREAGTKNQVMAGEVPVQPGVEPFFLDSSIEWEKTYEYRISIVTLVAQSGGPQQVEGDDSSEVTVVAHDVFPPAVPAGLQAVFSGPGQKPFIDLVWAPDTDADLAGYNVYRSEAGTEPKKINANPVKAPAFRDEAVLPGHEYTYSVSAVDVRGNESARSEPTQEKVPEK